MDENQKKLLMDQIRQQIENTKGVIQKGRQPIPGLEPAMPTPEEMARSRTADLRDINPDRGTVTPPELQDMMGTAQPSLEDLQHMTKPQEAISGEPGQMTEEDKFKLLRQYRQNQ